MPVYEYTAFNAKGRRLKGIVDAGSLFTARQRLRETDIFPITLREASSRKKDESFTEKLGGGFFKKVGQREVAAMTRQLSTLLGAGLPLVQSLSALISQISHPRMKKTLAQIREDVNEGNSLTQSMSHFPDIFPPFYINMVRAGEASGTINAVLDRLADFNEKQQALKGKIRAALAYPVFMMLIGSGVLFFLITFIVPNITKIFREMRQALPATTVFLISLSNFLQAFWWMVAIGLVAVFIVLRVAVTRTDRGRYVWDGLKLKLPLMGPLNKKMEVARFSRTLGTLLESGVPLLDSLEIVKSIAGNRLISDAIHTAGEEVREGQSLASPLAKSGLFPPVAIEMISVGEQSGNVETMLYRIADAYEKEVESNITMMTSLLEPIMILVMGFIVAFIVISILLPIFEMNQLVR
jgi:general secretion pathway protein F